MKSCNMYVFYAYKWTHYEGSNFANKKRLEVAGKYRPTQKLEGSCSTYMLIIVKKKYIRN